MVTKKIVHEQFCKKIAETIHQLQKTLYDLKESGSNETKSTAGDKHETALAMLQIQQAQVRKQMDIALEQKAIFEKINPNITPVEVVMGSLVKTNNGYFFVSAALGKIILKDKTVYAISPISPLGKALMGLQDNESVNFNNTKYCIEELL